MNHHERPTDKAVLEAPSRPGMAPDLPGTEENSGATLIPGPSTALRQLATLVTNVAILTALLVYFGWQRTETQAADLGVDENIFGFSTRDYLLRSVGPVLQLLAIVAAGGLAAVYLDRALRRRLENRGPTDRGLRITLCSMSVCWLLLPMLVYMAGLLHAAGSVPYVAFPLSIAAGVLLLVYASHLRHELRGRNSQPFGRLRIERASVVIALCVTVFWATSNYAVVIGHQVADKTINHVSDLTSVTVYSAKLLGISGPGIRVTPVRGSNQAYQYRYAGLRLLEHTGDKYFLIPDLWRPETGVVIMLDGAPSLRFEFGARSAEVTNPSSQRPPPAPATAWPSSGNHREQAGIVTLIKTRLLSN